MNNTKYFDNNTASKIGKLLGAEIILTGSYFEMLGKLRIDTRFINVETGEIIKSDGAEGEVKDFFKIQKQLTWKIIKNLDEKIKDDEQDKYIKPDDNKLLSLEDAKIYSQALDFYDSGEYNKSSKLINQLRVEYPEFQLLKIAIGRLEKKQ